MSSTVVVASLVAGQTAHADGIPLDVRLGQTIERDVGYARGWFCDDPSLVHAEVVTRGDHNVWRVTGVKIGATQCRVGIDPYAASYLFEVRISGRIRS